MGFDFAAICGSHCRATLLGCIADTHLEAVEAAFLIPPAGIPDAIGRWPEQVLRSPNRFLLGINLALLLSGRLIETSAAMIALAPILVPVAIHLGIGPIPVGLPDGRHLRAERVACPARYRVQTIRANAAAPAVRCVRLPWWSSRGGPQSAKPAD